MKLIFENWRKYLNEASQGMRTLESMPDDVFIEITKKPYARYVYRIKLIQGKKIVGDCGVEEVDADYELEDFEEKLDGAADEVFDEDAEDRWEELSRCDYAWTYKFKNLYTLHVSIEPHMKGYGPLLTDLAMELARKDNKWIMPAILGSGAGTEDVRRVYNFYLNKRSDVFKIPIDTECWKHFWGWDPSGLVEEFKYLYTKGPQKLNSEIAKTKIIWKN